MRILRLLAFGFMVQSLAAQNGVLGWQVKNGYRQADNQYYWKNRVPTPGYWQQDVHYKITARLDDTAERIDGRMELVYWNNSPDTLREVFFHLYQNAFQPESYLSDLFKSNKVKPEWGKYEAQQLGTRVNSIACSRPGDLMEMRMQLTPRLDNTIMQVSLPANFRLAPGDSLRFHIEFNTWFDRGSVRRRMKVYDVDSGYKHFNTVHWYPRISVYDRKFGWDVQQHMEHEFYGDFGTFDVELDLPAHYVTEATGTLLNPEQVYKDGWREKIDMANFKTPEQAAKAPLLLANPRERRFWRWHAENVHDFAWTSDPTYRVMEVKWNDISCIAIAEQQHAPKWQPTAEFVAFVVRTYSTDFGHYAYPKMVAADARDGMEYPMLTLDGGEWPSHQGLIAHEVGHNWFFGMIGNNETYRASLDEGFTQFLTSWCLRRYRNEFRHPNNIDDGTVYGRYLYDAMDRTDPILNTHSDDFHGALGHGGGYSHVYMKTATMLYNLEYVLGHDTFVGAMRFYFNRWKIGHPYVEDFRQAVHDYTRRDLVWFFDQWFETTKVCDYGIRKVKKTGEDRYAITLRRKEEMQMPIDLLVQDKKGNSQMYLIPNTYRYKTIHAGLRAKLMPYEWSLPGTVPINRATPWIGWSNIRRDYTLEVEAKGGIEQVVIDPSQRLADVYQLDNRLKDRCRRMKPLYWQKSGDMHRYVWRINPDLWYNATDQLKAGISFTGNYAQRKHRIDAFAWVNTRPMFNPGAEDPWRSTYSFSFNYTNRVARLFEYNLRHEWLDGLISSEAGISKRWGSNRAYANYRFMQRRDFRHVFGGDLNGQFGNLPGWWDASRWSEGRNASFNFGLFHDYKYYNGSGLMHLFARSAGPFSTHRYGWIGLEAVNRNTLGKLDIHTRFFGQFSGDDLPTESALYTAGDNPENQWHNSKFTRADWGGGDGRLAFPGLWWQQGGGLNLRGFANSLSTVKYGDSTVSLLRGSSGLSGNAEIDLDRLVRFAPRFTRNWLRMDAYLFADAGLVWGRHAGKTHSPVLLADAGVGTAFHFYRLLRKRGAAPFTLRFDLPLMRNITASGEPFIRPGQMLLIGVNRSF